MVVRLGRDGTYRGQDVAEVGEENLAECEELVGRGRAQVAAPLVGTSTRLPDGEPSRLLQRILEEERVTPASFGVPAAPELGSEGTWRALLVALPPLELEADGSGVWFRFALPKGAYATVVLREFLKPGPARGVGPTSDPRPQTPRAEPTNT